MRYVLLKRLYFRFDSRAGYKLKFSINYQFSVWNFKLCEFAKFCFLFLVFRKKNAECTEEGSYWWYWESLRDDKLSKKYNEAHFSRNIKTSQKYKNIKNVKILRSRKYHHILRSATSAKLTCQLEKNWDGSVRNLKYSWRNSGHIVLLEL